MRAVGTLKLVNVGRLTEAQRHELGNWLREQAIDLLDCGEQYADEFTSRSQTFTIGKRDNDDRRADHA
jgi:hypothetical protein